MYLQSMLHSKIKNMSAASKMWPDWEPSTAKSSEDEADAAALAGIGLALLGKAPFALTKNRVEVVEKLQPQLATVTD